MCVSTRGTRSAAIKGLNNNYAPERERERKRERNRKREREREREMKATQNVAFLSKAI
jgi:hypothetical protein